MFEVLVLQIEVSHRSLPLLLKFPVRTKTSLAAAETPNWQIWTALDSFFLKNSFFLIVFVCFFCALDFHLAYMQKVDL